jgi:membrane protease YdiL (CAAX protease family)
MRGTTPGSDPRFAYALIAMLAGPSMTAIVLTAFLYRRTGLRELVSRLVNWRVRARWYVVALVLPPVLMIVTLIALSMTSPAFLPGIVTSDERVSLLLISFTVGISAGVFEELGWTGFAIPELRRRYGAGATGVIVGIWWSAWHLLPNIWSSGAASGELAMPVYLAATAVGVFIGYLTAFRILMVWVYEYTESLLVAMLMHASFTSSLLMLNPFGLAGTHLQVYSFALAAALWVVVAVVATRAGVAAGPRPLRPNGRLAANEPALLPTAHVKVEVL